MVELVQGLPENVVGFRGIGRITSEDYETVLIPAVEAKLAEGNKLRLLYYLGEDFEGFDAGAMWDDAKVGLRHITSWERIAFVTDVEWLRETAKIFGFVMPGHVRVFKKSFAIFLFAIFFPYIPSFTKGGLGRIIFVCCFSFFKFPDIHK